MAAAMVVRAKRGKPRSVHVRTGCLTCKGRKVKCTEERPTCTRCDKAGFICKGYAVPKPWIFESRVSPRHGRTPSSSSTINSRNSYSPLLTRLTYGNSDPFRAFAVEINPTDHYYFKYYQISIIPQLYTIRNRQWTSSLARNERTACFDSLGDEATAYSLLARSAAIHELQSASTYTASSTAVLTYQYRAHAALRKKLSSLDDRIPDDHAVIHQAMWAAYLLAITDVILKRPSVKIHLHALRELFTRYAKVEGPPIDRPKFIFPFYVDFQYAAMTMSRPMFDILTWFPELENFSYSKWHVPNKSLNCDIHADVEDTTVRRMIMVKRQGQYVHRDLLDHHFDDDDLKHISFALHGRNIWFQTAILNVALNALDELQTLQILGRTDYIINTRAFIAVATLQWGRFASAFPVGEKLLLYDEAPVTLPLLRVLLLQHGFSSKSMKRKSSVRPYTHARFWALFVGAQAEQNRKDILSLGELCGDWFLNAFRAQAQAMKVTSWEQAVSILRQFLYNDHLKPHISTWWQ